MSETSSQQLKYAAVEFSVDNELLMATISANQSLEPQDAYLIADKLKNAGFAAHELDQDKLDTLAKLSADNESKTIEIEAHIDAKLSIAIDESQITATLSYSPAYCGNEVEYENVLEELETLNLTEAQVNAELISQTLQAGEACSVIIAEGKQAINGEDARVEVLFNTDSEYGPETQDDGTVDHYSTHTYVTVPEGTPLLKRIAPTDGTPGITVFGEVIDPVPGTDIQYELNETVKLDKNDFNILLARKSGHPIVKENSVFIDDTLTLNQASLETGNVQFDGSVQITGDVKPNVRIEASGDIFVEGLVENAELISGNNIHVQSGVISNTTVDNEEHAHGEYTTLIEADNDIHLKYCNSVEAHAGGSIFIDNYSLHSALKAQKEVVAGVNNGKGILIGGEAFANDRIEANVLGSEAYVASKVHCAGVTNAKQKYKKLRRKKERTENEHKLLSIVLEQIKSMGSPASVGKVQLQKAKKIFRELKVLKEDINAFKNQLSALREEMTNDRPNVIQVNKAIYPNIDVIIKGAKTKTTTTRKMCTIKNVNNEIEFS